MSVIGMVGGESQVPLQGMSWRWSQSCKEGIPIAWGLSSLEGIG